eukprot:TRINITY_DN24082_c0_g1_i1.p1 TRINITY_DN24082_c0_g1~~TRINITY_DN24082_c0_g1_i1.p1  ORF type:complete len:439 (-),score=51.79 TRINITY_DN24082_c0_g1_i1:154-1470(-)
MWGTVPAEQRQPSPMPMHASTGAMTTVTVRTASPMQRQTSPVRQFVGSATLQPQQHPIGSPMVASPAATPPIFSSVKGTQPATSTFMTPPPGRHLVVPPTAVPPGVTNRQQHLVRQQTMPAMPATGPLVVVPNSPHQSHRQLGLGRSQSFLQAQPYSMASSVSSLPGHGRQFKGAYGVAASESTAASEPPSSRAVSPHSVAPRVPLPLVVEMTGSEWLACTHCSTAIHPSAQSCPRCGAPRRGKQGSDKMKTGASSLVGLHYIIVSRTGYRRQCTVVEEHADEIKVHYFGFMSECDEWITKDSSRIVKGPADAPLEVEEDVPDVEASLRGSSPDPARSDIEGSFIVKKDEGESQERRGPIAGIERPPVVPVQNACSTSASPNDLDWLSWLLCCNRRENETDGHTGANRPPRRSSRSPAPRSPAPVRKTPPQTKQRRGP